MKASSRPAVREARWRTSPVAPPGEQAERRPLNSAAVTRSNSSGTRQY